MKGYSRWKRRRALTGYALAAPVLLGTLVFFALPFGLTFWYSLTFGPGGQTFVGLDNYAYVLSTRSFRLAAGNTLRFLGLGVPLILVISMLLRKHRKIRVKARPRAVSTRESTRAAMAWNTFCRRSPSTISMRQNRMIRVS